MGNCCAPQEQPPFNVEEWFNKLQLQQLFTQECVWENELERQIFMAINVCRFQPNLFLPIVDRVKRRCPLVANTNNTETLMK
jgi:hypothetical protein